MGLDSVELVIEIEKFFQIQISDSQAEKIYTVEDFTNIVAQHLNITSNSKELQEKVFLMLAEEMRKKESNHTIALMDRIADNLQAGEILRLNWENDRWIETPKAIYTNTESILNSLKKQVGWLPNYNWETITIEDFVDAICANNYKNLINPKEISSIYEVYIAIAGITADKIGIDVFEIRPQKSFTKDLGID